MQGWPQVTNVFVVHICLQPPWTNLAVPNMPVLEHPSIRVPCSRKASKRYMHYVHTSKRLGTLSCLRLATRSWHQTQDLAHEGRRAWRTFQRPSCTCGWLGWQRMPHVQRSTCTCQQPNCLCSTTEQALLWTAHAPEAMCLEHSNSSDSNTACLVEQHPAGSALYHIVCRKRLAVLQLRILGWVHHACVLSPDTHRACM